MTPPEELSARPLSFHQPQAMERAYELRSGAAAVGTLEFRSAFGSLALARVAGEAYSFKRIGFFSPRATARREGSEVDLAVYTPSWTGREGEATLAGGETIRFGAANFWGTRFAWADAAGRTLVTFGPEPEVRHLSDLFRTEAAVTVHPEAAARGDLPLLVLFGWYLVILRHHDAAGAAAVVGASS